MKRIIKSPLFVLQLSTLVFSLLFSAQTLAVPSDFTDEKVVGGMRQPVDFAVLPSGEMLILEKRGNILLTDPSASTALATAYLTVPDVDGAKEKGLLSIVLDPDFESNRYFYVFYHNARVDRARISRFLDEGGAASASSEFVIWEDNLTTSTQIIANHFGGGMSFGPDGYLYYTYGDKRDFPADSQDLSKTAGKIIRLDTAGANSGAPWSQGADNAHLIPDDNPFIDGPGGTPDEIWALGLRNPFRASWDIPTARLYIGEVGDNVQSGVDASYEDVHVVTTSDAGANFGYPNCEGPVCRGGNAPANYSAPLFSIVHPDSRAIIMGPVYRGNMYPAEYTNAMFYGDYANGWLRYLTLDESGAVSADVPEGGFEFASEGSMNNVVSIRTGKDGVLYYLTMGPRFELRSNKGELRRIVYDNANRPPAITAAMANTLSGDDEVLVVEFIGSATDPDGDALSYQWDFGDGSSATGEKIIHEFITDGQYEVVLSVSDSVSTTSSRPIVISVGDKPQASIAEPSQGMRFTAGNVIQVRGSGADPDGTLNNDNLRWTILFKHDDHVHPVISDEAGEACEPAGSSCLTFQVPVTGHDFSGDTGYEINLEVIDDSGLSAVETVSIEPEKVDISFDTDFPAAANVFLDQLPRSLPFVIDTLIGFEHSVEAPTALSAAGNGYQFSRWSNGATGALQRFAVPSNDNTYTALYTDTGPVRFPVTGLVAHFESDRGISLDGAGKVSKWTDQSGRGNDLTAVGDPMLIPGQLNGQAVIDFDGTGDALLRTTSLNALPLDDQDRSVYMLASYEGVGSGGFGYGSSADNQSFGLSIDSAGKLRVNAFGSSDKRSNSTGTGSGWLIQSATVKADQLVHSVNGLEIDSAYRSYQTQGQLMVLGADLDQSPAVDMKVAAVMVYDRALNEAEQSQLLSYLQDKYLEGSGVNTPPVALADNKTVAAGDTVLIDVLANDTDDGELVRSSVDIVATAQSGDLVLNTDGTISYTHDGGSSEFDAFSYTVQDDQGLVSNTATVTIEILSSQNNQPPVAVADQATVDTGGSVLIKVLANDTDDVELAANSVKLASQASSGEVQLNTDGTFNYRHDGGSDREDQFTYTVEDDQGLVSNAATVTIAIRTGQANQAPVAVADSMTLQAGGMALIDVLANDTDDVELAVNTVQVSSTTSAGTVTVNTDGSISYTHNNGSRSLDSFTYTVADDQGLVSNAATVTLTIIGVTGESGVPQAGLVAHFETDSGVSVIQGGAVTAWADQSTQGNDLTSVGDPRLIKRELNGKAAIDFDGTGDALLRSTVLNDFPTGSQDRTVYMIASYEGLGSGGFGFGTSALNQAFGLSINSQGKLRVNAFGNADALSNEQGSNAGWIMQSARLSSEQLVHKVNGYEIGRAQRSYQTQGDLMVLGADLDQTPAVDMKVAALLVYNRALSSAEQQSLETYLEEKYFVEQPSGNQPPLAVDDNAIVARGGTVVIEVLRNDTDDSALNIGRIQFVSDVSSGNISVNSDGTVSYTHDNSTSAQDNFSYRVLDDEGLISNTASVTITVTGNSDNTLPLSGLVGRFESDALIAQDDEGVVSSWGDQSDASNTLIAKGQPSIVPSVLNGLPVIDFDGNDDVLHRLTDVSSLPAGASDRTVYTVINYRGTGVGGTAWGEAEINKTFGTIVSRAGALALQGWGVTNDFNSGAAGANQGWVVQSATVSDNEVTHSLNGVEIDSFAHRYDTAPTTLVVGAEIDGSPFIDMQIAAIFIYDRALNEQEQQALQLYFEKKYF